MVTSGPRSADGRRKADAEFALATVGDAVLARADPGGVFDLVRDVLAAEAVSLRALLALRRADGSVRGRPRAPPMILASLDRT